MRYLIVLTVFLMIFAVQGFAFAEGSGLPASADASGEGVMVVGPDPYNFESTNPISGTISIKVNNLGDRGSPLQNIDKVTVEAKFSADELDYEIRITEPMINHINGRDQTWFGVVYNQKMHGDTNVGTNKLPEMEPDIALWGWAEISMNGEIIDSRVPAHVKVISDKPFTGIALEVGTQGQTLSNTADGYLHIRWSEIDQLALPKKQQKTREWLGWSGLLFINLLFGWLAIREPLADKGRD